MAPKEIGVLTLINFISRLQPVKVSGWGAALVWISEYTTPLLPFLEKSLINFGETLEKLGHSVINSKANMNEACIW